jgi:cytidylate kinase
MRCTPIRDVVSVLSALDSAEYSRQHPAKGPGAPEVKPVPFVTISRQAGAGGRAVARRLAARLNAVDPGELPWTVWDNELVELVARDHHLPRRAVASLEDERPSWLELALGSLSVSAGAEERHPDEVKVYHRVAQTIRSLAELGRVIIVGRGATFVTAGMPGGVHVRLVAPLDYRVDATAKTMSVSRDDAAKWVRDRDRNREAFYRRHWPGRPLTPESFTVTYNTAATSAERLVESMLPLVLGTAGTAKPAAVKPANAQPTVAAT